MPDVVTITPKNAPTPIGPYSHIAKVGTFITIGGVAGIDPRTGELAGRDVGAQARQVLKNMSSLLLGLLDGIQALRGLSRILLVFGRVPLLFYLLHM